VFRGCLKQAHSSMPKEVSGVGRNFFLACRLMEMDSQGGLLEPVRTARGAQIGLSWTCHDKRLTCWLNRAASSLTSSITGTLGGVISSSGNSRSKPLVLCDSENPTESSGAIFIMSGFRSGVTF
jgi:hypothetical protein